MAAEKGYQDIITLLIRFGGDKELSDYSGETVDDKLINFIDQEDSDDCAPKAQIVYSLDNYQENNSLFIWLKNNQLEEVYEVLVQYGYLDLNELMRKIKEGFSEKDLMKIKKQGLRLRLLYKLENELFHKKNAKNKEFPELKSCLNEQNLGQIYEKLERQGFCFIEDLVNIDRKKMLKSVLTELKITDLEISQIKNMLYRIETEVSERSVDEIGKNLSKRSKTNWGICCGFTFF